MSFLSKKSSNLEISLKEKSDENLKATINDKILEIIAKNNNIKEKVKLIIHYINFTNSDR
jgi:hypothetical protein